MKLDIMPKFLVISILIESMVGAIKNRNKWEIVTIIVGAILCPLLEADIFAALGMPIIAYGVTWQGELIGQILTGIVLSRGADYMITLWERVTSLKRNALPPS